MKTCKEIAEMWNVTERTVTAFCKSGKISGAIKIGKSWQIPDDAKRPADQRVKSGNYISGTVSKQKKPLPIGISDYVRAQSEYYYVDKKNEILEDVLKIATDDITERLYALLQGERLIASIRQLLWS